MKYKKEQSSTKYVLCRWDRLPISRVLNVIRVLGGLCIWFALTGFPCNRLFCQESMFPPITQVGKWGSAPYDGIAVHGNYAYCLLEGGGLDVLDISDPSIPIKTGECLTNSQPQAIRINGNYAYIAISDFYEQGGLQVIDITDAYAPFPVSFFDTGSTFDVDISGSYAYIVTQNIGLSVIDISNPSSLVNVGTYFTSDMVSDLAVKGNYVYMLNRSNLKIIDISNPFMPSLAGVYEMTYNAYFVLDITISGDYAYVAGVHFGLRIFDILNPTNPVLVGTYNPGMTEGVEVSGNIACLRGLYSLIILDVSNRSMPGLMAEFETSAGITGHSIDNNGNYVYAANSIEGLQVIDIRNPKSPTLTGSYNDISEWISDLTIRDHYAYLSEKKGLFIIDITNPAYPRLQGKVRTTYMSTHNIDISGSYAYLTDTSALNIIDITEPSLPEIIGCYCSHAGPEIYDLYGIKTRGNYAYTTRTNNSFLAIDVSNPGSPQLVDSNRDCDYGNIVVQDQYAYIAGRDSLDIMDISDPRAPLRTGSCNNLSWTYDAAIKDSRVYVTSQNGLAVVNVTDPASPVLEGTLNIGNWPGGIFIKNNYLYAAVSWEGLKIFDINDPSSLVPVSTLEIPGGALDVHVDGNYIYVNGRDNKLYIYWIGDIPVAVNSPAGTDTWPVGSPQTITWTTKTDPQPVDGNINIELYYNNVKTGTIAENIPVTAGSHSWQVGMFLDGARFLKPGKRYRIGVRTTGSNYLALSDDFFTIPSPGISLSLQASRNEDRGLLIKMLYGKLDILVEKETNALAVEKYLIKRKDNENQPHIVGEIYDWQLQNNSYTFFDTFLEPSKSYLYYIEAVNAAGFVLAVSNSKNI
jgi:hypothetical protein